MRILYFALCALCSLSANAQGRLDSIRILRQTTREADKVGTMHRTILKETRFDTNGVMTDQERRRYALTEAGEEVVDLYVLRYDPRTQLGSYYTEKPATAKNPTASKVETKYKNFDQADARLWVKQYDAASKLTQETQYGYDAKGRRIRTQSTDYTLQPPVVYIDEFERNDAGNIVRWEAYTEENGKQSKVREYVWNYLNDTLLLQTSGYLYNNWKQTTHSYDKKTLVRTKTVEEAGLRRDDGKTVKDDKETTTYDEAGRPVKIVEVLGGKKNQTITYEYADGYTKETAKSKTATTITETKETFQNKRLATRQVLVNGQLTAASQYTYTDSILTQEIQQEKQSNGDMWKTVLTYDAKGYLLTKTFYIQDKIKQEDSYEYEFHP